MTVPSRIVSSIPMVFMLLLIVSSTFLSCYAAQETCYTQKALCNRRRCRNICGGQAYYCKPNVILETCCCMNTTTSTTSGVKNHALLN
uniref:Knottin scorpion toxin-like domain-containing protein n=1 Tax=Leersia perrieri TaxID=77586 RepID=A0A0D9XVA5_9ORYZ